MIESGKARENHAFLSSDVGRSSVKGVVQLRIFDGNGREVNVGDVFREEFIGANGVIGNQTLDTAKEVFSKLAAGQTMYKIGKIAFGNSGHNYDNPKQAIPPTSADTELKAIERIKTSLNEADTDKHFLYQDGGGTNHRLVYIEKDILPEHITFGPNGNQFIVNVPISYDEYNLRVGGATTNDVNYEESSLLYQTINPADNTIMHFAGVDGNGDATADFTEVHSWDDSGTRRYNFKNGLDSNGAIDTANGGYRPQELSEIFLSTDIVGDGTTENPHKKLGTSRMTSGLLSFPESFTFLYSWTLSWNFS